MTAFVVRPFFTKNGIDFEKVAADLITPALRRLQFVGNTTQDIAQAGNIRSDMFQLLLTADVVIADISVHNANVFYELGVRHALRDKWTVLLRASIDEVPFDLRTDRYLSYNIGNPGASLEDLVATLSATRRNRIPDSPVYTMIPGLTPPDPSRFVVVPADFREEVRRASERREKGDLRFLASELDGFRWRREGLRVIAEAQFSLGDRAASADNWEAVHRELPDDTTANLRLGTLFQKLGDLVLSDEALGRVVGDSRLKPEDLAEARALLGSNAKTRWLGEWQSMTEDEMQKEALRSPFLREAITEYRRGFEAEPRHYYSGLNALAMVTVLTELAVACPDIWLERFANEEEATFELRKFQVLRTQLNGAAEFSLAAGRQLLLRRNETDPWLEVSFADHAFLSGRPNAAAMYREALKKLGVEAIESVSRQIQIFRDLGILKQSVNALARLLTTPSSVSRAPQPPMVLLFTGHRIDDHDRKAPRFPPSAEAVGREAIRAALLAQMPSDGSPVIAIAGGASGGDLLFLELCEELGFDRRMFLMIPSDDFRTASVASSGPRWIDSFHHQLETATCRQYQRTKDLPDWLADKPKYNIWERANNWMLHNALYLGGTRTTLIALWDGAEGDGAGGTEHMVRTARARGAKTVLLDSEVLFGFGRKAGG